MYPSGPADCALRVALTGGQSSVFPPPPWRAQEGAWRNRARFVEAAHLLGRCHFLYQTNREKGDQINTTKAMKRQDSHFPCGPAD